MERKLRIFCIVVRAFLLLDPLTPPRILANITEPRFLTLANISCHPPLSRRFNVEASNGVSPGVDFPGLVISATSAILNMGNIRLILYFPGV